MKIFKHQTFQRFYDRDSARKFSHICFYDCCFQSSAISITLEPNLRSTVNNVNLHDCELQGCSLNSAVVEDVLVDGLKTNGLAQAFGSVFSHVTLKGKIGRIMLSSLVSPGRATQQQQRAFQIANEEFYARVDWALDISRAEFEECDLRGGIPARLIRRDPETQVVITRTRALSGEWRKLDLSGTYWGASFENLLKDGNPERVLVAPKRSRQFKPLLRGLQLLREAGIAEPD